jgi:hypothetical protein
METADAPGHIYLGGKLGFIYGSISVVAIVFGLFCIPETKRLELEDIDKHLAVLVRKDLETVEDRLYEDETTVTEVPK